MARPRKENPRCNAVSTHLEELLSRSRTSVSRFMRDAMRHFAALHEHEGRERLAV